MLIMEIVDSMAVSLLTRKVELECNLTSQLLLEYHFPDLLILAQVTNNYNFALLLDMAAFLIALM